MEEHEETAWPCLTYMFLYMYMCAHECTCQWAHVFVSEFMYLC